MPAARNPPASCALSPVVPSSLLIRRHQYSQGQFTRIEPLKVSCWVLSSGELAEHCRCPVEALRFSRVGPVFLAHGGVWAQLEALDSLRWPHLDRPVIHGPAVAVRPLLARDRFTGETFAPGCWRALTPWEACNAQWVLSEYTGPLMPRSCPADEAFLRSLGWPQHEHYCQAKRAGDVAAMLRIRLAHRA